MGLVKKLFDVISTKRWCRRMYNSTVSTVYVKCGIYIPQGAGEDGSQWHCRETDKAYGVVDHHDVHPKGIRQGADYSHLKQLNKAINGEQFILPAADEIVTGLRSSAVFPLSDAVAGFWQIPLNNGCQNY